MVWIVAFVALVAASVYGAYLLLDRVDPFGPLGPVRPLPRALVYAAAVVVACQAVNGAMGVHRVSDNLTALASGERTQAVIQVLATTAAETAWQAGLLLAAAALAARAGGEVRRAQ